VRDPNSDAAIDVDKTSHRLIIELASPSLAVWAKSQLSAQSAGGRLDINSAAAQGYVAQLRSEQVAFVNAMRTALPTASVSNYINENGQPKAASYQVVFNGMAVDPGTSDRDAARQALNSLPGVKAVYLDYAHYTDLYTSTSLINAPVLWNSAAIGGRANAGKGVKVASMDGGVHHSAPMFSGAGFSYPPGYPAGGLGLTANNNGKIIASRVYFRSWDPPSPGDENPWPGTQGTPHGNHTAGIAAGDIVTATYLGLTVPNMSGVAPGAWIMSYRVFYNSVTNDGSFYDAEGIAALEDIAKDGADVLNNSWGDVPRSVGGEFDALDTALRNTAAAGVFVSMSTGNAGPSLGTGDHSSPDYINVAASTTSGTLAAGRLNVIAPTPISPTLQNMSFAGAEFGAPLPIASLITYTFAAATGANVQGCNPFAAGTFTGKAALILRGVCDFSLKVYNAQVAGATFVVVYNDAARGDALVSMAAGAHASDVTISSVFVGYTNGSGMVNWAATYGAASVLELDTLAFQAGNAPDRIAAFSSRGPGVGNVLKPDIAAPGVNILSQGFAPGVTGEARHLGFGQASGTSMAAPHVAGAAALLRQIHPDWSNAYIKSALMSTAKYTDIYLENSTIPAQPLDMGAGRLDLTHAADPGVILDPPSLSFGLVPTGTTKAMQVVLTSVATQTETYATGTWFTGGGFPGTVTLPGFSVSPASITLAPGASAMITVTFNPAPSQGMSDNQGYILMTGSKHNAHMPAWARVTSGSFLKDILIIDNDGSSLGLGFPDHVSYYTATLSAIGYTYDVLDVDNLAGSATNFVPDAVTLSAYRAVIYFTGDYYYPNGSFPVPTPLTTQDMDRLTEYANGGGVVIAMGQDLASVLGAAATATPETDNRPTLYSSVLGGNWLQDSVTEGMTPTLPIIAATTAPKAFQGTSLDVSLSGDGAGNQFFIDEIAPRPNSNSNDPNSALPYYTPLFKYPGASNIQDGIVAMAHRDQPTLERAGISYYGRSIYTTFGLEGVNGATARRDLIKKTLESAWDEASVVISDTTPITNSSKLVTFVATVTSMVGGGTGTGILPIGTGTIPTGVSYRWDFGDGTAYTAPFAGNEVGHNYQFCGIYTVRVEGVDSFGNHAIGSLPVNITDKCAFHLVYLPIVMK
jgi:subtilisin family serine protease